VHGSVCGLSLAGKQTQRTGACCQADFTAIRAAFREGQQKRLHRCRIDLRGRMSATMHFVDPARKHTRFPASARRQACWLLRWVVSRSLRAAGISRRRSVWCRASTAPVGTVPCAESASEATGIYGICLSSVFTQSCIGRSAHRQARQMDSVVANSTASKRRRLCRCQQARAHRLGSADETHRVRHFTAGAQVLIYRIIQQGFETAET
jgi:hypothetical protein